MPTSKKRINITLPPDIETALDFLARRDEVPEATKAAQLIKLAIEIDEDDALNKLAQKRDTKKAPFVSHKDAWK
jgi:hypothetical protein